jgi:plastocyanin
MRALSRLAVVVLAGAPAFVLPDTVHFGVGRWELGVVAASPPQRSVGTIRGRVDVAPAPPVEGRPNVAALGMPAHTPRPERRQSVVYLETAPRPAFDARPQARARIDQRDETFVPRVLAIVAGTTVDFPNSDVTYHNVFSFSKPRPFDLGRYAAGRSRSVRFDEPGIVRVFCDIHSHMTAYVLVFAHRYFAVTDQEGRYRLDGVPPGRYTVVAWNESAPQVSERVVIPEAGGDAEVNFRLGRR